MSRRILALALSLSIPVVAAGIPCAAQGPRQTVYQLADGTVRPSRFPGAKEAYLPIIVNSNHAANLLALPNGDLLCFWFAGTWEGKPGVSIAMSRLDHGTDRWAQPVILATHPGWSDQNPVAFRAPDGKLWMFHTSQKGSDQTNAVVYQLVSEDNGHTWSAPKSLFTEPGSFIRQPLVVLKDEWLFPTYHSASKGITENAENDHSVVKVSKDHGGSWTDCDVPHSGGMVQMNIIKLSDSNLIAFYRSRFADWIYRSASSDGCHWSEPVRTQLPNNNASIQVTRLRNGHLVLVFNNAQAGTSQGKPTTAGRGVLSVALSVDDGKTWPWVRDLQSGPEPPYFFTAEHLEYAYPSVAESADGQIHTAFTFRRETIKHMTFHEDWIKQGSTAGVFQGDAKP